MMHYTSSNQKADNKPRWPLLTYYRYTFYNGFPYLSLRKTCSFPLSLAQVSINNKQHGRPCHETNFTRARCYASNAIFILIGCYYDIPPFRENDSKCSKLHLLNQVSVENENVFQVLMPLIGCIYSKNMSVMHSVQM